MSIDGWMIKENIVPIYSGMLFSHEKEVYPAICDNMDETGRHYEITK